MYTKNRFDSDISPWKQAWSKTDRSSPVIHERLIEAVNSQINVAGKKVIEIGSGTGIDSIYLSKIGAKSYVLDFVPEALEITQRLSSDHNVTVYPVAGDTLSLPYSDESFDLIFSQGLIEHFHDPYAVVREQVRILRKGALLLIDVPQKYSLYTVYKKRQMRQNRWFAGWETEFSLSELHDLVCAVNLEPLITYGHGYFPAVFLGLRNLHTLNERHDMPFWLPEGIKDAIERVYIRLESASWFHRWLTNIGIVARKR